MFDQRYAYKMHAISEMENKDMANGMRDTSGTPLTEEEIAFVKEEIRRIQADESIFVFNDPEHMKGSTCYNYDEDLVYVTRNVFPDKRYASAHPRDVMSVGAVLAHEYYGHRAYRQEYLEDLKKEKNYHTTPIWRDECRASLTAAHNAPGLNAFDRRDLVMDAVFRAQEFGQMIEMNDFMKEAVYGYSSDERKITREFKEPKYVSEGSQETNPQGRNNERSLSPLRKLPGIRNDPER